MTTLVSQIDSLLTQLDSALDEPLPTAQSPPKVSSSVNREENKEIESSEPRFTLAYWKMRGLAQSARYILAYSGHGNYNDVAYEQGDPPSFDRSEWLSVKYKLGFDFPNLPYLIDHKNNVKITESNAIYQYLARTFNIGSVAINDGSESSRISQAYEEMLLFRISDLASTFMRVCYNRTAFAAARKQFLEDLPLHLRLLETWLNGGNTNDSKLSPQRRKWLGGDHICVADFKLCELLDAFNEFEPTALKPFPELKRLYRQFFGLPQLQTFIKTHPSMKWIFNNKSAAWN